MLTTKQAAFVSEYTKDHNATQAAIRAGYSPHTARSVGSENLTKPDIKAALAAVNRTAVQVVAERTGEATLTAARIIEEASRIAFGDIRDLVSWDGSSVILHASDTLTPAQAAMVKEVRVQKTTTRLRDGTESENETREVKVWDKLSALALLAKTFPEFSDKIDARVLHGVVKVERGTRRLTEGEPQ